jgi:hypothetical protein
MLIGATFTTISSFDVNEAVMRGLDPRIHLFKDRLPGQARQ